MRIRFQADADLRAPTSHGKSYDPLSPEERSERMRRIRQADTKPEMVVRRIVHGLGYRYGLHSRSLPGCPDLVFRSRKKIILVHGCFWHQHKNCHQYRMPRSKLEFWLPKLEGNKRRDLANQKKLAYLGWHILVIWECQLNKPKVLERRIKGFLEP